MCVGLDRLDGLEEVGRSAIFQLLFQDDGLIIGTRQFSGGKGDLLIYVEIYLLILLL